MTIEWHVEKRAIADLKDYPKNPRRMSKEKAEKLQSNITKFGLIDVPFINTDNTLIGGHQRCKILKKMGHKEIDVKVPSRTLSSEEIEELNITHNLVTGEFDYDVLANNYEVPNLIEYGFSFENLLGHNESHEDSDEKPKKKKMKMCPSCGFEF